MKELGGGIYSISAVKEIKVTDGFHSLTEEQKQCQILETYEDCMTQQLWDRMNKNCGCIPFELQNFTSSSVRISVSFDVYLKPILMVGWLSGLGGFAF